MAGCKTRSSIRNLVVPAGGSVELSLDADTVEYALQVVSAAGAGVAWALSYRGSPDDYHFAAGAGWTEERLRMDAPLDLLVTAAAASVVELITWEG